MHVSGSYGRARRFLSVVVTLLMVAAFLPVGMGVAAPSEFYVDAVNGDDSTGDGSAGNPWQSIGWAMEEVAPGDTVWVEPGTYDDTVEVLFPIAVGTGVAVRSTGGPDVTIVDAGGSDAVFSIVDATTGTQLEGFTITGGGTVNGGGIDIKRFDTGPIPVGWPKISGCIINENERMGFLGGGIAVYGATDATCAPLVEDCVISNNRANYGGGVSCREQTALELRDCTVSGNTCLYAGGGVYLTQTFDAKLIRCDLSSNVATDVGGALSTASNSLESVVLMDGCYVADNTGVEEGGGVYADNATVEMEATEFVSNTAELGDGGGIKFNGSDGYVTDCLIQDNSSGDDGGPLAVNSGSVVTVTHCSIGGNTGVDNAGIYNNSSTLNIYNSIVGGHGGDDLIGSASVAYSCFESAGVTGPGVIHEDPMMFHPPSGDLRLRVGSPCIDTAGLVETDNDDFEGNPRPIDGDGNGSALPDMGCWERPDLDVARYAGTNRYDTACQMAEATFGSATTAIIASGENFPDALSAAGLAGAYDAPLLLVKRTSVPSQVKTTLTNLGVEDVVVVGGAAAVSGEVYDWFQTTGGYNVSRVFGNTRYETSAEVALEIERIMGAAHPSGVALFARGDAFPDALAAAPLAYNSVLPILLVKPASVPTPILDAMDTLDVDEGFVLGGPAAILNTTKATIDAEIMGNGGSASERWAGDDRYETAATVADNGWADGFTAFDYVGIATGTDFPDALAGGVVAGRGNGVLLLTRPTSLPTATRDSLSYYGEIVLYAEVFGGTSAVSDSVQAAVFDALGW